MEPDLQERHIVFFPEASTGTYPFFFSLFESTDKLLSVQKI